MIYLGCDVGSLTAKAVILKDDKILASEIIRAKASPVESAKEVVEKTLAKASLTMEEIDGTVSTGYGKDQVDFTDESRSEISCHAKGAWWARPSTKVVIDIGGQDAKAIRVDDKGNVLTYRYNDKCATGTGRFLEVMAKALEVDLEKMGEIADQSTVKINLSNQCIIFAETEVVSLINEGVAVPDIVNGLNRSLTNRVVALANSVGVEGDVVFTGGVAKNAGVFKAMETALKTKLLTPDGQDPQIIGALGAAIFAQELNEKL
jgi:predicted CoA-substrate-specific enzyme activase